MTRFIDQVHEFRYIECPIVENVTWRFLCGEMNDARWTIDFHRQRIVIGQLRQVFLGLFGWQFQQFTQTIQIDAGVIVGNDANILK